VVILPAKPRIPVPFAPSRMTVKISASVEPCFHMASVRSAGGGFSVAPPLPSPFPSAPWHDMQFFVNNCLPSARVVALTGTGFFSVVASAAAPFWGEPDAARASGNVSADVNNRIRKLQRIDRGLLDGLSSISII